MGKRVELLVMIALVIAVCIIAVIIFLDLQKGIRDSKRKADIGIIAGSLEIHHNTKKNDFCQNAESGTYCHPQYPWFQGGVPHDPLLGDYLNLPKNGDQNFLICAKLESGGGNAQDSNGIPASGSKALYYCQKNQQ